MRLINTSTLKLDEFTDAKHAPLYAIPSHRWGRDEVSLKAYRKERQRESAGYRKIVAACAFARDRGQNWLWIDTCCVDKTASAELSEAINSMFQWYRRADECYAYLGDVTASLETKDLIGEQFRNSTWFTRGWSKS